jgi:hypothetical protein
MSQPATEDPTARALRMAREEWTAPYREALERIRDHGKTHKEPCWALHKGDCADAMQEIARAVLADSGQA